MSGGITVSADRPSNAWRQRGFVDGSAGRDQRPPADEPGRVAYLAGHRLGSAQRSKETAP